MATESIDYQIIGTPPSIFEGSGFLAAFRKELKNSSLVTIVPGFFTKDGFETVRDDLIRFLKSGGKIRIYAEADPGWSNLELLQKFQSTFDSQVIVRLFNPDHDVPGYLHSKVVVFNKRDGGKSVIIGSVNFTGPAFNSNLETAVLLNTTQKSLIDDLLTKICRKAIPISKEDARRYKEFKEKKTKTASDRIFRRRSLSRPNRIPGWPSPKSRYWKVSAGHRTGTHRGSDYFWTIFDEEGIIAIGHSPKSSIVKKFKEIGPGDVVVCTRGWRGSDPSRLMGIGRLRAGRAGQYIDVLSDGENTQSDLRQKLIKRGDFAYRHVRGVGWVWERGTPLSDLNPAIEKAHLKPHAVYEIKNPKTIRAINNLLRRVGG